MKTLSEFLNEAVEKSFEITINDKDNNLKSTNKIKAKDWRNALLKHPIIKKSDEYDDYKTWFTGKGSEDETLQSVVSALKKSANMDVIVKEI